MNNFDWIVTVAVGSLLASTVLVKDVTLVEGVLAIGLLLALQFAVTLATSRWEWARSAVLAPPSLLYFRGQFLTDAMRRERVSRNEILAAVRESGASSIDEVGAIVLESDADLSVLREDDGSKDLTSLPGYDSLIDPERP